MTRRSTWLLAAALGAASCGAGPGPGPEVRGLQFAPPETLLAPGQLQVFVPSNLASDGRRIRLRGTVRNPYPEAVDGVRLLFRLLSRAAADAPELERFERTLTARVAPGGQLGVNWDIESGYAGAAGWSFEVQAFAVRRGDSAVPPPRGWRS